MEKIFENTIGAEHEQNFIDSVYGKKPLKIVIETAPFRTYKGQEVGKFISGTLGNRVVGFSLRTDSEQIKKWLTEDKPIPKLEEKFDFTVDKKIFEIPVFDKKVYNMPDNICMRKWDEDKQEWVKSDPNHIHSPDCVPAYMVTSNDNPPIKKPSVWKIIKKFFKILFTPQFDIYR